MSFQLYHLVQLDQPTQMRQLINAFRTPLTNVNDRVGPEGTKGSRMVIRLHPSKWSGPISVVPGPPLGPIRHAGLGKPRSGTATIIESPLQVG